MFSFENLFNTRKYYVLKDAQGKILAGVQAEPDRWSIHEMPGERFQNSSIVDSCDYAYLLEQILAMQVPIREWRAKELEFEL